MPDRATLASESPSSAQRNAAFSIALVVGIICGCQRQGGKPIGELVGAYAIDGALIENTCGQMALPTVDPLTYQVEVRQSGRVGYWQLEKRAAQAGMLSDDGSFMFRSEQTTLVGRSTTARNDLEPTDFTSLAPDFDLQTKNCLMTVRETIEGKLTHSLLGNPFDAGAGVDAGDNQRPRNAKDLTGYDQIEVSATPESDCSGSLAALGGPFLALPCSARYDLEGKLQDGLPD